MFVYMYMCAHMYGRGQFCGVMQAFWCEIVAKLLLPACIWKPSLLRSVKTVTWVTAKSLIAVLLHSASPPDSAILPTEIMFLRYNTLFTSMKIQSRCIFPWIQWFFSLNGEVNLWQLHNWSSFLRWHNTWGIWYCRYSINKWMWNINIQKWSSILLSRTMARSVLPFSHKC